SAAFIVRLGVPRDRHSFPTRRSSDLGFGAATGLGAGAIADGGISFMTAGFAATARLAGFSAAAGLASSSAMMRRIDARISSIEGDRKSTRLNSSHVSISYAVFCLKKK